MVRCVGSNVVGNHLLNQSRGLRMTDEKKNAPTINGWIS